MQRFLIGLALTAGIIGLALLGLAFGQSLRASTLMALSVHPLFDAGIGCVMAALLALQFSRPAAEPASKPSKQ